MNDKELIWFLDRLVHDLREPLRSITAFSELLAEGGGEREIIAEVVGGAERMRVLIDGLARYALAVEPSPEATRASLQLATDLAIAGLDPEIRKSGATVTAAGLPEVPVRLERLMQLMRELIANSLLFRNSEAPLIQISACEKEDLIEVMIEDNGLGIASADAEKVFLPFARVYGRKYPGAGLGLTVARRIVENHGGQIRMKPKENGAQPGGNCCLFTLPLE